jgi:hypothetical protein
MVLLEKEEDEEEDKKKKKKSIFISFGIFRKTLNV